MHAQRSASVAAQRLALSLALLAGAPVSLAAEGSVLTLDSACEHGCEHAKLSVYSEWLASQGEGKAAGFDAETGRDLRTFAPTRVVDFLHMRLEMTIDDMDVPAASCTQTLSISPISNEVSRLTLDARGMKITSVTSEELASQGISISHDHDGQKLSLSFSPAMPLGTIANVVIRYELNDPSRGLLWTPSSPLRPGQAPQLHTQGQAETNSYWFPCHDSPNERLTTELLVTVPQGFAVSSNGSLQSVSKTMRRRPGVAGRSDRLQPYETFHWLQNKPHVNYLVSLVVGKFDVVDVGDLEFGVKPEKGVEPLAMPVYVPPGRGGDVLRSYGKTRDMVRVFEERLSEKYPWDRYAQILAWNFEAGGMENTSATTMHENAVLSEQAAIDHARDLQGLIAHELGHQWFGDLVTCNSWEHIWLNEGWATYCESLWFEASEGEAGLTREVMSDFDRVINADRGSLPATPGMASKVYTHPWETFRRGANPYPKGASILQMLRRKLGDEVFFQGVANYIDAHKPGSEGTGNVETFQFRQALEAVSGMDLQQFFEQWTTRPNIPRLSISYKWVPERARLRVTVEQNQPIDADNPAFEFGLPMFLKNTAGPDVIIEHPVRSKREVFEVDLEGAPAFVAVNHDLSLLAEINIEQDEAAWAAQLASGPSLASKTYALRALASQKEKLPRVQEQLRSFAANTQQPSFMRAAAVSALAGRESHADIANLVSNTSDNWEARNAVVDALVKLARPANNITPEALEELQATTHWQRAHRTLENWARVDQSLKVRANAIRGLAEIASPVAEEIARASLDTSSHADIIRMAGIDALARVKPSDAVATIATYASAAFDNRTRDAALNAIARQLETRSGRVRRGAGEALVALGDKRAIAKFEEAIANTTSREIADVYRGQLERLTKN
jgi:aminopeptidase N